MIRAHLQRNGVFFPAATIMVAILISSAARSAEKPVAGGELKTLDEIAKTLPRFDVSGKVIDKKGKPVPGAEVWLYYARGRNGLRDRLAGRRKTAEDGTYTFEKAILWEPQTEQGRSHESHYIVIAKHPDHGIYFKKIFKDDPADNVEIPIRRNTFGKEQNKTRTITVTDKDGNPIAGAKVYLCGGRALKLEQEALDRTYHYIRFLQDIGIISGFTDEKGMVTLQLAPAANYWVEKEGYNRTWIPGSKGVMFTGARVSGTVRYPDGTPAVGAAVSYVYHGDRLVWDEVTVADKEGRYLFKNVPASGFYYSWMDPESERGATGSGGVVASDLRVNSPFLTKKETFTIRPGDKLEKDITFGTGLTLAGTVIDLTTDKPAPRMQMRMLIETGQRYLDTKPVTTDENGRFETSVAPGSNVRFSWEESRNEGDYLIDEQWRRQGNYQPSFRKTIT
ncbi:MAG: carboxypeptidase-like regulatory domain-containing protein, partial [Planctomycetota bacterium]